MDHKGSVYVILWKVGHWELTILKGIHSQIPSSVWNKFQGNPLNSWGSLGILGDMGICEWMGKEMMATPLTEGYKRRNKTIVEGEDKAERKRKRIRRKTAKCWKTNGKWGRWWEVRHWQEHIRLRLEPH